jgi:hypothetical protein
MAEKFCTWSDIVPSRSIAEKTDANIQRWTEMEKGGHFAARSSRRRLPLRFRIFFPAASLA